jgi:hypothetical protein
MVNNMNSLTRRINKIEQKVGSDTTVIRTLTDFIAYTDALKKGVAVGKVEFEPKLAEIIRRSAQAERAKGSIK